MLLSTNGHSSNTCYVHPPSWHHPKHIWMCIFAMGSQWWSGLHCVVQYPLSVSGTFQCHRMVLAHDPKIIHSVIHAVLSYNGIRLFTLEKPSSHHRSYMHSFYHNRTVCIERQALTEDTVPQTKQYWNVAWESIFKISKTCQKSISHFRNVFTS